MRLLVFDFDGTIANTEEAIMLTISQTLKQLGRSIPPENHIRSYIGLPLARIFEEICGTKDSSFISEAVRIYRARFPANCKSTTSLYPGVRETLNDLRAKGISLAIASSRERHSLLSLAEQLGIRSDFSIIAGEQDVSRHKPEPDIANFVLEQTHISPANAMFIGDTVFDIRAGNAAGMKTCGVSYGNHTRSQLVEAGADYVIDRFPELLDII